MLHVQVLSNLTGILLNVSELSSTGQYENLKVVYIEDYQELKKLFSSKLLLKLKNLDQIDVGRCGAKEELIAVDDDANKERSHKEFCLPKLKVLSLYEKPKLKSICCCNRVIICDSHQVMELWYCLKLMKVLSSSKLRPEVLKNFGRA
ncbi:hypothetical protein Ddye_008753 [Dipteronia dyeriana]|uniref:Disease resistance protein At4g27190-like leucine-rich repeats domain-containing protein n=1 Tax=Dipteronia dyeriana TaxID=168575 RepID=A0AAD9XAL1_9ROSI|nr:hypothetical protein Ddye_008753 [Dipteronia dyeriana]